MRVAHALVPLFSCCAIGCSTTNIKGAPVDAVINELKRQLKDVPPFVLNYSGEKECQSDGNYKIVAFPTKATAQLKTVLTKSNTVALGASFGTPIVAAPSYSHISTSVRTAQSTIAFCVVPKDTSHLKTPFTPESDCTWKLKEGEKAEKSFEYVKLLWPNITETTVKPDDPAQDRTKLKTVTPDDQPRIPSLKDIYDSSIRGIVYSTHAGACLQPQNVDIQVAFEVAAENDGGFKLTFGIFNIGDTRTSKRDYTNTLDVIFELDRGSTPARLLTITE